MKRKRRTQEQITKDAKNFQKDMYERMFGKIPPGYTVQKFKKGPSGNWLRQTYDKTMGGIGKGLVEKMGR